MEDQAAFLAALQSGRVENGGYQRGRVVDLREVGSKPLYLVGDVHAKPQRIRDVLQAAGLESQLEKEESVLVFLGDLFHREDRERAGEMETSLETFRLLMELKTRFPRSLYSLLGNHEFTRTGSTKQGYFQGDLFREALDQAGLLEVYREFVCSSPMVVVHPRCVGVHAGPARSVESFEELCSFVLDDSEAEDLPKVVRELSFSRHIDWAPNVEKAYDDHQVRDFLALCGVPEARLVTGHTPLDRETDWSWDIGQHSTVIFAAGREVGYYRAAPEGEELVRVGRSLPSDDETLVWDRAPQDQGELVGGRKGVTLESFEEPVQLMPDLTYRFSYPGSALTISGDFELRICHYRHLNPASQAYYAQGYYLVGNEFRQEVLKLKRDLSVLLGGEPLCEGVRFSWGETEIGVLRQNDEGEFELRTFLEGLSLSA